MKIGKVMEKSENTSKTYVSLNPDRYVETHARMQYESRISFLMITLHSLKTKGYCRFHYQYT